MDSGSLITRYCVVGGSLEEVDEIGMGVDSSAGLEFWFVRRRDCFQSRLLCLIVDIQRMVSCQQ